MRTRFQRQQGVVSQYLTSYVESGSTTIDWSKVADGTVAKLIIGLRNWVLFKYFLIATYVSFLAGAFFSEYYFSIAGSMLVYLWPVFLMVSLIYGRNMISPDLIRCNRKYYERAVRDMFRFLWHFGHWPENMTKEEVEHVLGKRLKQVGTSNPHERILHSKYERCLKIAEKFFGRLTPIGVTDDGLTRSVKV